MLHRRHCQPGAAQRDTPAALRDVDWRFVLPRSRGRQFGRLLLCGGSSDLVARILQTDLAQEVICEPCRKGSVDAAVVLHGADVSIASVAASLNQDGVVYFEVNRLRRQRVLWTPTCVAKAFRNAGLAPLAVYGVLSSFSERRVYLPLEVREPASWFLRTIYNPSTPVRRVLGMAIAVALRAGPRCLSALTPYYAVTAMVGTVPRRLPSVLDDPSLSSIPWERTYRPMVLTDAGNRAVILPFEAGCKRPAWVLKVPKLPVFNRYTENEQRSLLHIREHLGSDLLPALPQPLGLLRWGEISVAMENSVDGQSLKRSSSMWGATIDRKIQDLQLAAEWLARFHAQTSTLRIWDGEESTRWNNELLESYVTVFNATEGEKKLFAAARQRADALRGQAIPIVWQHGDYNVWNIFRSEHGVSIIDWEGARRGLPGCDLLHFLTHWFELVDHSSTVPERLRSFRRLFLNCGANTRVAVAVDAVITSYLVHLQLSRAFVPLLLVYTWVELALRRRTQLQEHGQDSGDFRKNNVIVQYLGVLAEDPDRLFTSSWLNFARTKRKAE